MKQLKDKIRNKLNNKGFSLTELLASILIMMLATGVLTSTITLASNHYEEQTLKSKADILCNSLSYVIRDRLSHVYKYEKDEETKKEYYYSTDSSWRNVPFNIISNSGELQYDIKGDNTKILVVPESNYSDGALKADANIEGTEVQDSDGDIWYFTVTVSIYDKSYSGDPDSETNDIPLSQSKFIVYPFSGDVIYMGPIGSTGSSGG